MKHTRARSATRLFIAAMALSLGGLASAADAARADRPIRAESRLPADAPLLGRIVVTPRPKPLAQARRSADNDTVTAAQRTQRENGRLAL